MNREKLNRQDAKKAKFAKKSKNCHFLFSDQSDSRIGMAQA